MKGVILFLIVISIALSCKTVTTPIDKPINQSDTVHIASEKVEYEIIIIDAGFNPFLYGQARPRGYYSQSYLEQRNRVLVYEWNNRFRQPLLFDQDLYQMPIDYDSTIDYGYEVNYLLYNYFIYFQRKYKQQLSTFGTRL